MSKMNIEVMEQPLKDLAANVGYDLIPAPFDTPFEEARIESLPDSKQFFWPVPSSVLNDKEHEEFRKILVEADIIDTVCTTSLPWPSDEKDSVAILLIDVTRRRRGSIKFVDACIYDFTKDEVQMYVVCNMLIHDYFPGESFLAFQVYDDVIDFDLDYPWNERVAIFALRDINSLHPSNYLYKLGLNGDDIIGDFFEICNPSKEDSLSNVSYPAILISALGKLCPEKIESAEELQKKSLEDKLLLIPNEGTNVDAALLQLTKEEVLRQLPLFRRITENDLWRVKIENDGVYHYEPKDLDELLQKLKGLNRSSDK